MPCILEDPTWAVCLSFESDEWEFLRQSMIDAHLGAIPLTHEGATQHLKETWARENNSKIAAWNAQLEQDRVEQEEQDRLTQEEEDACQVQCEKEAEEQRKEVEKKKPKMNTFDPNRLIPTWIEPIPAPYAINKINNLEYIELDYFTVKGCREANADTSKSISQDTLAFTQLEDTIAIHPLAALRPSRTIRNDEDLSWEEMLQAKNTMLHFMAKSAVWLTANAESLAAFFVALELHPRVLQINGKKALLLYQSWARREWFDALKRDKGFNIEQIGEDLLQTLAEEVNERVRDKEFDQVRSLANLNTECALTSLPFFSSPPHNLPLHSPTAYTLPCHFLYSLFTICFHATCYLPLAICHCHLPPAILPCTCAIKPPPPPHQRLFFLPPPQYLSSHNLIH